jgi:hypothetical protein
MISEKRNIQDLRHAQKCVKRLSKKRLTKKGLTDNERQELYYWEYRVEEEYAKPAI